MRRIQRGDGPLAHGEIGHTIEADVAVAPRLYARPLDDVVERIGLDGAKELEIAARVHRPRAVCGDDDVVEMGPVRRIRRFERGVFGHLDLPVAEGAVVLRGKVVLAVGPHADDDGESTRPVRPVDIDGDLKAGASRHTDVSLNEHFRLG